MKKILINIFKFAIVGCLLWYMIRSGRLNFRRLTFLYEFPATTFSLIGVLVLWIIPLTALRLKLLLSGAGLRISFMRCLAITWIGNFFNVTLPGAVSGDLVKAYYAIKVDDQIGITKTLTALVIDRFSGLFGLIVLAFFSLLFSSAFIYSEKSIQPLALAVVGLFFLTTGFYILIFVNYGKNKDPFVRLLQKIPKLKFLLNIYRAFKDYQHKKWILMSTLAISVVIHFTISVLFYVVSQLSGLASISFANQILIMPLGLISLALPIAPGGIGVGHAAFDYLYKLFGVSGGADIFNIIIIVQLFVFAFGGIPYLVYKQEKHVLDRQGSIDQLSTISKN